MIHVDRKSNELTALNKPYGRGVKPPKLVDRTEQETVIKRVQEYRRKHPQNRCSNKKVPKFSFPFERYKDPEVGKELDRLFHGKCAYCESRYAGTQPMDIEHWRPKGGIFVEGKGLINPGYYWLAAVWTNLLPSCIDCNRAREQFDVFRNENVVLGKQNQFPLLRESTRIIGHDNDPNADCGTEAVALINPCLDDPEAFFVYDENGVISPMSKDRNSDDWKRAMASIRVYALNRADLVADRRAKIRLIDHRLKLINRLVDIRDSLRPRGDDDIAELVNDIVAEEIDVLQEMGEDDQPYAGVARYILGEANGALPAAWGAGR